MSNCYNCYKGLEKTKRNNKINKKTYDIIQYLASLQNQTSINSTIQQYIGNPAFPIKQELCSNSVYMKRWVQNKKTLDDSGKKVLGPYRDIFTWITNRKQFFNSFRMQLWFDIPIPNTYVKYLNKNLNKNKIWYSRYTLLGSTSQKLVDWSEDDKDAPIWSVKSNLGTEYLVCDFELSMDNISGFWFAFDNTDNKIKDIFKNSKLKYLQPIYTGYRLVKKNNKFYKFSKTTAAYNAGNDSCVELPSGEAFFGCIGWHATKKYAKIQTNGTGEKLTKLGEKWGQCFKNISLKIFNNSKQGKYKWLKSNPLPITNSNQAGDPLNNSNYKNFFFIWGIWADYATQSYLLFPNNKSFKIDGEQYTFGRFPKYTFPNCPPSQCNNISTNVNKQSDTCWNIKKNGNLDCRALGGKPNKNLPNQTGKQCQNFSYPQNPYSAFISNLGSAVIFQTQQQLFYNQTHLIN